MSTSPTTVSQFDAQHPLSTMRAEWNGDYTLYALPPKPGGQRQAVVKTHLKKGEALGFRQRETGVVAVAGGLEQPVSSGQYEWVMEADPNQLTVLGVVAVVVLSVLIVAATIFILAVLADPI
jgi:hypothetical protein